MVRLVLLRHGQSQWNLENRFTGWVDVDLTSDGEAQARQLPRLEGRSRWRCDGAWALPAPGEEKKAHPQEGGGKKADWAGGHGYGRLHLEDLDILAPTRGN